MLLILLFVLAVFIAPMVVVGIKANERGQSPAGWCILALFTRWLALLILVLTVPKPRQRGEFSYHDAVKQQHTSWWYCQCGCRNSLESKNCMECHTERPEYWVCHKCGAKNDLALAYCSACGVPNRMSTRKEKAIGSWYCKKCGTKNSNNSDYCINCCNQKDQE